MRVRNWENPTFSRTEYQDKGLDRSKGIQGDIFWNTDGNIYIFATTLDNLYTDFDLANADIVVDRESVGDGFYYHVREIGIIGDGDWKIKNDNQVQIVDATYDCGTNQLTMPSLPAGSYRMSYHENIGSTEYSTEVFTYALKYDSHSVVGSASTEISLGGGAEIQVCGQGFGAYTDVEICDLACTYVSSSTDGSQECRVCSAAALSDVSTDVTCDLRLSDSHTGEEIIVSNAIDYKMALTPILTGLDKQSGGSLGGSTINLTGSNFSDDASQVEVTILGSVCDVQSASATQITCVTNAYPRDVSSYSAVPAIKINGKGFAWHDPVNEEASTFEYVDLWSSTYTWGCTDGSCFPQEGDIIVIPAGYRVVLDVDTPLLKALLVDGGELIIRSDQDTVTLKAEYIVVNNNGAFTVGTEEEPYDCSKNVEIVLYGHHRSIKLPLFGAKVLAVRTGTLDLHGCRREHTWNLLSQTALAGTSDIYMQVEPDWNVGDTIVIATTGGRKSQKETEVHTIQAINGNHITLDSPLEYEHLAVDTDFVASDGEVRTFQQRAEVGVLNRNIKIRGSTHPEWRDVIPECEDGISVGLNEVQTCFRGQFGEEIDSDQFGATVMMHKVTHGKIEYVEVTHAGQAFGLGRYALHYHLSGDQPNSYIRGCSIHESFNRALTMHAVNYLTVEHNVAYNVMGLTYFIEDANEEHNVIQYNLAVFTRPSSSLLNVDQTPTSFWITNPNNIVRHNHAAGGSSFGFWINPPAHPTGPSFTEDYCPRQQVIGEFHNNTAHSFGVYGMWIFEEYSASKDGSCFEDLPGGEMKPSNWGEHVLSEFYSWGCERGVEMTLGGGHSLHRFMSANNEISQIAVMETTGPKHEYAQAMKVTDSIVAGYTNAWPKGSALDGGVTSIGLETPWKFSTFFADGISFYNFDNDGVAVDPCYSSYPFDCVNTQWFSNTKWTNVDKKIRFDWEHELQLIDLDGTFTENEVIGAENPSSYIVIRDTDIVNKDNCYSDAQFSTDQQPGIACDYATTYLLRTAWNQPDPDTLAGFPALVTTQYGQSHIPFRFKRSTSPFGWAGFLVANEHNRLEYEPLRGNHTFGAGTIRFFRENDWMTLETPFIEENIDRYEFGADVNTGINRNVSSIPTFNDEALAWNLESQTGIFHQIGEDHSHINNESMKFTYKAYVKAESEVGGEDIVGESCTWSEASCWENGRVPGPNDDVFITENNEVVVDIPLARANYVYLGKNARLTFNTTGDIVFRAKGIQLGVPTASTDDLAARKRRGLPDMVKTKFRTRRSTDPISDVARHLKRALFFLISE